MTLQFATHAAPAPACLQGRRALGYGCDSGARHACAAGAATGVVQAMRKSAQIFRRGADSWRRTAFAVMEMTARDVCAASVAVAMPPRAPQESLRVVRDCVGGSCLLGGMAMEIAADVGYPLFRRLDLTLERLVGTP